MGLLDFLKKGKNNVREEEKKTPTKQVQAEEIQVSYLDGGKRVQIEFYNPNANWDQFYDTTRLIIDRLAHKIGDSSVNDCLISWYGRDDAIMEEYDSRQDYERILATLDVERMVSDRQYCSFAMKQLLNRKRVQEYLERGKSLEDQEHPCGNYIGEIIQGTDGNLRKRFDCKVGEASHYSPYMVEKRKEIKQQKEMQNAKRKAELESQIKDAENELNSL